VHKIGAFEAKNTLGSLLDRVERGEEVIISRRGKPVAKLVPADSGMNKEARQDAVAALRTLAKEIKGRPFSWNELKKYRDEGRR
jgi:prevent-host-death family protein